MERVKTEHEELAERLGPIRALLSACREAADNEGDRAECHASAMATHLATLKTADLPAAAQVIWLERVVRPLKADASKPLPSRAFSAIRSWPTARVTELSRALAQIEAIVIDAENDALHEVIYAEISRTYS